MLVHAIEYFAGQPASNRVHRMVEAPAVTPEAQAVLDQQNAAAESLASGNDLTLREQLLAALDANRGFQGENAAFLALGAAPSAGQVRDHTIRLAKHSNAYAKELTGLIRLVLRQLDSTS